MNPEIDIIGQEIIADLQIAPELINKYFDSFSEEDVNIIIGAINNIYTTLNKRRFLEG